MADRPLQDAVTRLADLTGKALGGTRPLVQHLVPGRDPTTRVVLLRKHLIQTKNPYPQ